MNEQKRPGGAFWCVVALTLPILYVLSMGPGCWVSSRFGGAKAVTIVYRPVTWAAELTGSDFIMLGIQKYSRLGTRENPEYWCWTFSPESPGSASWSVAYLDVLPSDLLMPPGPPSP